MVRRWVSGLLLLLLHLGAGFGGSAAVCAAEFWIAPNGDDAHPGTRNRPFATLERARSAVRAAKAQSGGGSMVQTVWIRGGDYFRTNSLELTVADSGASNAPVIWQSVPGETVRFLGGRILTGFRPVTEPAILDRLDPVARGKVLRLDLKAQGISEYGRLTSRGFGRPTAAAHGELFWSHRPMTLARWPNEGEFARLAGYPPTADHVDEHGGNVGELAGGFLYSGDRPRRWRDPTNVWVHGYWSYDWANSYERIESLDLERRWIKTAPPHGLYSFRKGQRFYFLNVLEELDQPGEWFLDSSRGELFFWPPAETRGETLFSTLERPFLSCNQASFLTLRGLTFEAARGHGVEIRGGEGVRLEGCKLINLGNSAVVVDGGSNHQVAACEISDTGDGGVSLTGGDRQTLTPGRHAVEDCHFQRLGRWSKCYVPAVTLTGVGLRAAHNLIHDLPHCGILFWGNDHEIEYNEIHRIALETGDVGAIYTGRDYSFRGNRIRYNYIHHTGGVGMGSMGVYMDDCVSGSEVSGNVFFRVHWAMFIGGGRDHLVDNNLFVECDPAVRVDGRGLDRTPVWRDMVDDYMRKRLNEVPQALYRQRYPALATLDAVYGAPGNPPRTGKDFPGAAPTGNRLRRNVCVGKWLETGWNAAPGGLHLEDNVTDAAGSLAAPLGDHPAARDFVLKPESPAWAGGFRRIPVEQIGPRGKVAGAGASVMPTADSKRRRGKDAR